MDSATVQVLSSSGCYGRFGARTGVKAGMMRPAVTVVTIAIGVVWIIAGVVGTVAGCYMANVFDIEGGGGKWENYLLCLPGVGVVGIGIVSIRAARAYGRGTPGSEGTLGVIVVLSLLLLVTIGRMAIRMLPELFR